MSGPPAQPPGGSGLVVPLTAAVLAFQRLDDLVDELSRKVHSSRVSPGGGGFTAPVRPRPVERRVLAMATAARSAMRGGPRASIPANRPGSGIGQFALLGALGFELPGFASVLAPGGGWVADLLRRGTPDPDRSRVAVPAAELPLAVARAGLAAAGTDAAAGSAVRGFSLGMLAAAAAGVTVGPQLSDLLAADTRRDWQRFSPSRGAAAAERYARRRFLGEETSPAPVTTWLPPAASVPDAVWTGLLGGIADVYRVPAQRPLGFSAFEKGFDAGDPLTAVHLRNAYGLVLDDLRTSSWPAAAWFGLLTPVLLAPSVAMLAARGLPHASAFLTAGAKVDERAVFELLTVSMAIGSLAPFVYSMILWGSVDEHTEVFATALILFLARAALATAGLVTSSDKNQSALLRWLGIVTPLAGADVYAAVRAALGGSHRPGDSTVFALQTLPALTGLTTLSVSGIMKVAGISDGWPFWLTWSLFSLATWLGAGIPASLALAHGGGWRSWFLRSDRRFPLLSSVAAAGLLPPEPVAQARVFDDSTLWPDPATSTSDLAGHDYPSGMRGLVRVWWEGAGTLEVQYADDAVTFRTPAGTTPVRLPAGTTAAALAQLLPAALAGVKAEVLEPGEPDPELAYPQVLADPGDDGPLADTAAARVSFVPVGTSRSRALVVRHAPRADLSSTAGLLAVDPQAFPVVPVAGLGDLEGTGLGAASDLATLLAVAAAPSLGTVTVSDGLAPVALPQTKEVVQAFRRWNLDERRLAEWQALVTGGGPVEGRASAPPDPLVRTPPSGYGGAQPVGEELVAAMGWIPLWRAWVRVATDAAADVEANVAMPATPLVRFPDGSVRRPTNAALTEGVRFLLDLPAT